ncbi:uncharacterized protein LOC134252314, partial [Saccostrea cucullata]|uniref:uncharacterized protein LOC134252314 n=1 Tax=Saccostrea cuccullata TaxID=36930 RepID=UPI002ED33497
MEYLSVFITIGLFLKVFGSCPQNKPNPKVTSCDGTTKNGTQVYIDFEKINKPCNCIATPAFDGELLVGAEVTVYPCDAYVKVNSTFLFNCKVKSEYVALKVQSSNPVTVEADYKSESSRKGFYHCLLFNENMG